MYEVKGTVEHIGDTSVEAIKGRVKGALERRPLTWLAEQTGDDYKNVQRWVNGPTEPPPDFLGRACLRLKIDGHWLLTGEGDRGRRPPTHAEAMLRRVLDALGVKDIPPEDITPV